MCNFSRIQLVTYFHPTVKKFFQKKYLPESVNLGFFLISQPRQKKVSEEVDIVKDFVG